MPSAKPRRKTSRYASKTFKSRMAPGMARPSAASRPARAPRESERASGRIAKLEQELSATKEYLQSVIETQEATNEELQSANEELQSANEELSTVNDELRSRNQEVTLINNDLTNLFASIDIAVVMIGSDFNIRRFTPQAQKFLSLIPGDVGRHLLNINPTMEVPEFQSLVLQVMSSSRPVEREFSDGQGGRYQLRIFPYRTPENKIDGAVITIVNITAQSLSETA